MLYFDRCDDSKLDNVCNRVDPIHVAREGVGQDRKRDEEEDASMER